ncbi:MAG: helix-turn-helix domain-containing protein [Sneathiella sp.]
MKYLIDNISARMSAKGLKPKTLSRLAGLSPTAVRDILTSKSQNPRADTIAAIADVLGCDAGDLLTDVTKSPSLAVRPVPIIGAVEAGNWVEAVEWQQSEWLYEPIPDDARMIGRTRFGLVVRGKSMDLVYREGDIVICTPVYESPEPMESGRRYVIYRHSKAGIEATLKEYFVDKEGKEWLLPKSTDPAHQTPVELENPDGSTNHVEVYARVTGVWSREP